MVFETSTVMSSFFKSVFGILEALEHLVSQGEQPKRTFYIAFGHDEELSGHQVS
jgi:acetylornithine deacetylase/succinyl-diaminopimelate desuccinylase-like protein